MERWAPTPKQCEFLSTPRVSPTSRRSAPVLPVRCAGRPAGTGDAYEEVTEALVEPLDVRQHAHGRMVRTVREAVHAVAEARSPCMRSSAAATPRTRPQTRGPPTFRAPARSAPHNRATGRTEAHLVSHRLGTNARHGATGRANVPVYRCPK